MNTSFDYPRLLGRATLGLVKEVLARVAESGLPGEHHFYLTFETGADGVELSDSLRSRYPETMTVVLQHQYTDLIVTEEGFGVTLRFGGSWEQLWVPFEALTAFLDPSVPFGLDFAQFAALDEGADAGAEADEGTAGPGGSREVEPDRAAPEAGSGGDLLPFRPR